MWLSLSKHGHAGRGTSYASEANVRLQDTIIVACVAHTGRVRRQGRGVGVKQADALVEGGNDSSSACLTRPIGP